MVLCGGRSTRMGRDKALLPVAGVPMAIRVAAALEEAGASEVVAAGGDEPALRALGLRVVPDAEPGAGPLPAVLGALEACAEDLVLVVGCDLVSPDPTAMAAVVRALAGDPAALVAVPVADGVRQWAHAAWRTAARAPLAAGRAAGAGSLRRAAAPLPAVEVLGLPPAALLDADRPGDLPERG